MIVGNFQNWGSLLCTRAQHTCCARSMIRRFKSRTTRILYIVLLVFSHFFILQRETHKQAGCHSLRFYTDTHWKEALAYLPLDNGERERKGKRTITIHYLPKPSHSPSPSQSSLSLSLSLSLNKKASSDFPVDKVKKQKRIQRSFLFLSPFSEKTFLSFPPIFFRFSPVFTNFN